MNLTTQIIWLFILAIPIACISWTVTHEEIFREPRQWCVGRSQNDKKILSRKFFYLFTCEYCFSHYVVIGILFLTHFQFLYPGWRGYILAGFSLVWIANIYMGLYSYIRMDIKKDKITIAEKEEALKN